MTIALRPLRPVRPVRPLLRKDADQLGLFGDVTPVKPTPKAKARAKLYGNVAAPVVPKPKAAPKPTATPGKKPKEGDTRTNRAGNKEVLRGGRWRLADNPQVVAKDKPAAIVPVVEDLREADLVDEALPDVPMADPEITPVAAEPAKTKTASAKPASYFITPRNISNEWSKFTKMEYMVPDYDNITIEEQWKDVKPEEIDYYQDRYNVVEIADNPVSASAPSGTPASKRTKKIKIRDQQLNYHKFKTMREAKAFVQANLEDLRAGDQRYEQMMDEAIMKPTTTPEPTPEPMPEEAGEMAGGAPKPAEDAIQFDTTAEPLTKKQDVMNLAEQVSEKIKGTQVSLTLEGGLKYDVTIAGAKVLDLGKGQYLVAAKISEGKITRANGSTRDLTGTLDPQIARNIYTTAVGLPLDSIRGGKMTAYRVDGIGGITATGKILTTAGSAKKVKFDLGRQAVDYPLRAEPEPMPEEAGGMAGDAPELKPKGRGKSSKPDGEGSDRPGPRRAKAGGEYGPNNEWYEGGKFIPSEDKPKVLGSKKAKPKEEGEEQSPAKKAKVEKRSPRPVPVGPDEMAVLPKGKSSIYLYLSGRYIKPVGDDGIMQIKDPDVLNAQLEMDYQQAKSRGSLVANHGMISELVRRWNDGERFYDSEELRSMMDSPRKGERSEVPGAIAGGGGDGSESAGDGVSGRSGGFSGKDRLPDMEPAKVEVGTYSPILRYPPREQKGGRQWVDMAKQHTPEDWRRIGDFFEGKLKNLGSEEIPMTMGEFQSDFSNEDIKDHLNLVQGTITARKVQKYPDFARAMNLMELYAGLHPQMKFIIWPKPESRYAAYPDDSPSAKPKTENDQHMRRLLRLMNEALDTPGRERVTLPDRTVQRRSPAPSLQAPPGFRVNKFGGVASDGTQIAAGEGYIRNEDGRWKIYSKDQVDSDGNILTKSLRPYPGPYLTLLGVRYILDRGILRKAGMSWEDFRCEAEAMHKEAQGDDDPCWKGYEAVGLKRKGKRMVPNCVPVSR